MRSLWEGRFSLPLIFPKHIVPLPLLSSYYTFREIDLM